MSCCQTAISLFPVGADCVWAAMYYENGGQVQGDNVCINQLMNNGKCVYWDSVKSDQLYKDTYVSDDINSNSDYLRTSNISHTWAIHKIIDHSGVVGASPVGAANYIAIRGLTAAFNGLCKDIPKTKTFQVL